MADDVVNLTKSQQTAVPAAASAVNTPATETAKAVAEAAAAVTPPAPPQKKSDVIADEKYQRI